FFFFFQAEDGIRDFHVTGVQTCALPISSNGNGEYIDGSNTDQAVEAVVELLDRMDRTEFEAKQFAEYQDQFQWFLAAGFLFLFLDIFLLDRKTQWLKKLNLFNEHDDI